METEDTEKKLRSSLSRENSESRDENNKYKISPSNNRSSSKDKNNKKSRASASNDVESGDESTRLSKSARGSLSPKKNTSRSDNLKDTPESEGKINKSPKSSKEDSLSKDTSKTSSWLTLLKESSESEDENKSSKSKSSTTSISNKKSKSNLSNENVESEDENKETPILSTKSSPFQEKNTSLSENETNKSPKISKGDSSSKDRKKKKSQLSLQKQSSESEDEKKDSPNLSKFSCRTRQIKNSVSPKAVTQSCYSKKLSLTHDDSDIVVNRSGGSEIESKSKSVSDLSPNLSKPGSASKANSSTKSTSPKEISKNHNNSKKKLSLSLGDSDTDVNRSQNVSRGGSKIISESNSESVLLGDFETENDHNIKTCINRRDSDLIHFSSSPEDLLKDSETKDKSKMSKSELATLDSCVNIGISHDRSKKRSVGKGTSIDLKFGEKDIVTSNSNFEVSQEQIGGLNKSFDSADQLENNNSKRESCESEDSGIKEMEILTNLGNLNVDTPINELILEHLNDQLEPFFQCNNITPTRKSDESELKNSSINMLDMSTLEENYGEDVSLNVDTSKSKEKIDLNSTSPNKTVNQSEKNIKFSGSPVDDRTEMKNLLRESADDNSAKLNKKPRLSAISDVFDCIEEVEKHYDNTPSKNNESVKILNNSNISHDCNTLNDVNKDSKVECLNRCSKSNEDLDFSLDGDINFSTGGSATESKSVETDASTDSDIRETQKLSGSKKKEKNISPTNKTSPRVSRFSISDLDVSKKLTENSKKFKIEDKSASQNRKSSLDKGKDDNCLKKEILDKTDEKIEKSYNSVNIPECKLPSRKSTSNTTEKLKDYKKVNILSEDLIKEIKDDKETSEKIFSSAESEPFKSDSDDLASSDDGSELKSRKSNSFTTEKLKDPEVNSLSKGVVKEVKGDKKTSKGSNFSSSESEQFDSDSDDFASIDGSSKNDKCRESKTNSKAAISGRDFIDDEAKEGEETDPDDDDSNDSSEESDGSSSFTKDEKSLRNENNSSGKHSGDSTEMSDSDFSVSSTDLSESVENHISESKPMVDQVLITNSKTQKKPEKTFNEIYNTKFSSKMGSLLEKFVPVKEKQKVTENILSNKKSVSKDLQKCKMAKNYKFDVLSLNSKENQVEEKSQFTVDVKKGDLRDTLIKKKIIEKQEKYFSGKDKTEKRKNSEEIKSDRNMESLKRKKQKVEINEDTGSSIKCNNFSNFMSYPCKNTGKRKIDEVENSDKKIYSSKLFVVESFSKVAGNNKLSNTSKVVQNTCGKFSVEGEKSNEKKPQSVVPDSRVVPSKNGRFIVSKEQPKSSLPKCHNNIVTTKCCSFDIKKCDSFEKSKSLEPRTNVEQRNKNLQMDDRHLGHRKNVSFNKNNDTPSPSEDPSSVNTEYKAYICNLPVTNAVQLKEIFEAEDIKNLKKIDLSDCKPRFFIKGKGYGHVYFKNERDLKRAINMRHRLKISGRKVMLRADHSYSPKDDKSAAWLIKSLNEYIKDMEKFGS